MMSERTFGAHWLAFLGPLQPGQEEALQKAARLAKLSDCTMFELACKPINGLSARVTAEALLGSGISTASFCRFFPGDGSLGDPLNQHEGLVDTAVMTIEEDIRFIDGLRSAGLTVEHVTGPSVFCLGRDYSLTRDQKRDAICKFTSRIAARMANANLTLNVEYLRPGEDMCAIGSMAELCHLIDTIDHPNVKVHGDIFHMLEREEAPHEAIEMADHRLGYLHAHGSKRIAPGSYRLDGNADATDTVNWYLVSRALASIGYKGPIVPEPFGEEIRKAVPELGEGLPPAIEGRRYYQRTLQHLQKEEVL